MRLVIFGGTGFIGRHVTRLLADWGHQVTVFDLVPWNTAAAASVVGDIRDPDSVDRAMAACDRWMNLAGILGTAETVDRPMPSVCTNLLGSLHIYAAARRLGTPGLAIGVGNHFMNNSYSITRTCAERFALMYNAEHGTKIALVRGLNVYGPGQKARPIRKLVPNLVESALHAEPITIYGDGAQIMDMIYVDDIARVLALALLTEHGVYDRVFEAGSGRRTTVNEIAEAVIRVSGSRSQIVHVAMRPGEIAGSVVLADTRTLAPLGVDPAAFRSLDEGLAETILWRRRKDG
jgi:UDP-glucose 4-epimerase